VRSSGAPPATGPAPRADQPMPAYRNRVRCAGASFDDLVETGARRPAARATRGRSRAPRPLRRAVRAALRATRSRFGC
jgi:hypothetical protein